MVEKLINVDVVGRQDITPELFLLHLTAESEKFENWLPGAHIDVQVGDGSLRQFSLVGSLEKPDSWILGIRSEVNGRGGSIWLNENARPGSKLKVSQPRNHFSFLPSDSRAIFIAGGIGVTPIYPMIVEASKAGRNWELHYVASSKENMILLQEIDDLAGNVFLYPRDTSNRPDIKSIIESTAGEVAVYCCGPESLLQSVEDASQGLDRVDLHVERFSPKPQISDGGLDTFEVKFVYSDLTANIKAGESILEAARALGIEVTSSCKEGTCGSCETPIISGAPQHLDSVLSEKERSEGKCMMICVSRSLTPVLELDL